MSRDRNQRRRDRAATKSSSPETGASSTVDLSEDEILEMQGSMDSEWGGGPPRKAKAFWPSALRLFATFGDHKLGLAVVLAFGIASTLLTVWAPRIIGDATDVIYDGATSGDGVDFTLLGRLLMIVLGMYLVAALFDWLQGRILNDVVMRIVYRLRERIEEKVNRLPLSYFDTRQRGDLLSAPPMTSTTCRAPSSRPSPPWSTRCSPSSASP